MTENLPIQVNLKRIQQTLRALEKKYNRSANSVQLLAVSKTISAAEILTTYKCGQTHFGESYAQEAVEKIQILSNVKLDWHFIGPIQKNKTSLIAQHFTWAHSLDRLIIAQRLDDQRPKSLAPLQVCIQVNIDQESTKAGVDIDEIPSLAASIVKLERIKLRGLMAIPLASSDTQQQRESFAKLRLQLEHLNQQGFELDTLSMGMSGDLEAAVAEGATMVRVGTAIFGNRTTKNIEYK
jgi:pyridoxal phosphate enzyme (YggS family)